MPPSPTYSVNKVKPIGITADHEGLELKRYLIGKLRESGIETTDFGGDLSNEEDDYPESVLPLAMAISSGHIERGVAISGTGVGVSVAANKIPDVRACLISEMYSAHQGVEADNLNVICFGGRVLGPALAWELLQTFLSAKFNQSEHHLRHVEKGLRLATTAIPKPTADWAFIQRKLKARWETLTDSDLLFVEGEHEELLNRIQDRTGETRDVIERAYDSICSSEIHQ